MWLASPALPVGGFSYSEGLEAAIDAGLAADEAGGRQWLLDQLHLAWRAPTCRWSPPRSTPGSSAISPASTP